MRPLPGERSIYFLKGRGVLSFMRCLVTGGTGLIGSNIVKALLEQGHEVIITGHDAEQKIPGFKGKYLQASFIGLDWDALGKLDVVCHQAAMNDTTMLDRREMFRMNVDSALELFRRVVAQGCKRIVYASSTAVYGDVVPPYKEDGPLNPLNPYAESKKALEDQANEFARKHPDVTLVGLRYCNVYGPGESHKGKRATMIFQLAQQMLHSNPVIFKWGDQKREYIYVKDVVRANLLAAEAKQSCVVNCGSGKATTFKQLVSILNRLLGTNRVPQYIDNPYTGMYQDHIECDMTQAKLQLGFVPEFDIDKGIEDYYKTGLLVPCDVHSVISVRKV